MAPVKKRAKKKVAKKKVAKKKVAKKKVARKKVVKKKVAKKKVAKKKAKRKPNAAFMAPWIPSPELAAVVGSKPLPRTEVTKKIWIYIKKHKLQNPANMREIIADAVLKKVFGGKKKVNMFAMTKLIGNHLKKK